MLKPLVAVLFGVGLFFTGCAVKKPIPVPTAGSGSCTCTCSGTTCTCVCAYTCEVPPTGPAAASSLTAVNQPNAATPTIKLDWKDNSANETGFKVMRRASNGADPFALVATTAANIATYTDGGLTNYWQYDYEVIATNATGDGPASNVVVGVQALVTVTIPPGTGASIKDFGAKGDGTTDDKASIQNAINSCAAGGTILFPAGTYKVSGTLSVKANCTYSGQNAPILRGYTGTGAGGYTLMQTGGSGITITGITFDGGGIFLPVEMQTGITIAGNRFQNIVNSNGGFGPWFVGIYIPATMTKSNIHHNSFYNILPGGSETATDKWMTGIRAWKLSEVVIADNTFDRVEEGIAISESDDATLTLPEYADNKIQRNTFTHIRRIPIEVQAHKLRRILIEDNHVSQYLGNMYWNTFGISHAADGWDGIIRRNVLDSTGAAGAAGSAGYCIELGGGQNMLAEANECRGTGHWKVGIMVKYAPAAKVSNNQLCGGVSQAPTAYETPFVDQMGHPATFTNNAVVATCPPLRRR